jgi:hydroxymethylglutaryl-CoA lyase
MLIQRSYVSCIFADPYDGPTPPAAVLRCVASLLDYGCYEVSLGDTLGVGVPSDVRQLLSYLEANEIPIQKLAGHFHDTYGSAVANAWEAYKCGIRVFDGSVAGLGGCPFAPGAKGNVSSEDLVYMFERAGVQTGVDLLKLAETGVWISKQLSIPNASRAGAAVTASRQKQGAKKALPKLNWELVRQTEGLEVYRSGVNLKLVLSRPKNGNALTSTMIADLTAQIRDADRDTQTSRLIITGNGKFFCTGMDLATGSTPVGEGGSTSDAQYSRLYNLFEAIDQSSKVTIACLNGPAFGGGVGLAFACDIRVATKNASVTLSEVKLGLSPATISKYVIREFGFAFAREAMLSARTVSAVELHQRGLVSQLAPSANELIDTLLDRLKIASPEGSRMSKQLVRLAWADAGKEAQEKGIRAVFDAMMRPDAEGAYGVKEFQSKRPVDWDVYSLGRASKAKL